MPSIWSLGVQLPRDLADSGQQLLQALGGQIVYATLIVKGLKTLDQVPGLIKTQVEEILVALEVEV